MIRAYNVAFHELHLTPEEVYEVMGYGSVTPEKEITEMVKAAINHLAAFVIPRCCYFIAKGELTATTLSVGAVTLDIGKIISRQLRGSEQFVFFAATAGKEFEAWMDCLKDTDDIVMQYIADSLGSCLAEKTADYMEKVLQEEISSQGWLHTNRFSPGYCEWHVSEQKKLFSLFPVDRPCGIELTESSLMMPIKSVSGVIGIGRKVKKMPYSCGICGFERCYRRK
ncbi:vitamin B12 dependent-methionine synthase activation domain-containing protein [Bacteroides sp. 224]|uniref:vitamin B12 dependent-methionine synthase activation domain-containing protein n=1 Tax=Bacteroides sp. 224 TaxID=2302936 RepID=UPI0013D01F64|nr:vitamin B12 dependent-methionine synthase activation domain-containing protein [Bacteroides sp. 224]NDV64742.1 methionine synthase [Bacteroides sp. 224]